jgi:hypothetical protein
MQTRYPLLAGIALSTLLLLQSATPALAFSITVSSGATTNLSSAQFTDVKNTCIALKLGTSSFCQSVAQKAIAVKETGDPDIVLTVKETRYKRFLTTFAGAVLGVTLNSVEFKTLSGSGLFDGPANHIVEKSWGSIYFESGKKSSGADTTIQITIDTKPAPFQLGSISGVATSSGNPVKGATVAATMQGDPTINGQATTDTAGHYTITGLPPGTYDVEAAASGYQTLQVNGVVVSTAADTPLDLTMTFQLGSISGVATSSGNPVKGATVAAAMQGDPATNGQATTDSAGRYSITNLPPGTYNIEAAASSYQPLQANGVVVAAGADTPVDLGMTLLPCSDRPVKDFVGVGFIDEILGRRESGGATSTEEYVTESMRHIRLNGFTAIRVPYYWESYVYNPTEFTQRVEFIAQTAQQNNICAFFANFHYTTTSYWNYKFANGLGRGFPSFIVQDYPLVNNDYIQTAGPFWDAFWSNTIVINGSPVWDVQADFLQTVINRVDQYDSVAGYEILNEPHFFDPGHYDKAGDYHTYMAKKIREVSQKKIYFVRETTWGFTRDPSSEPKIVPRGVTGIVYAPHLYAIPYPGSQAETQIQNFKTWSQLWGSEVLIGETVADTQADAEQLLTSFKENGFGWTVWSWKPTASTGSGRTYYESDTVEATEVLKILLAAMAKIY